MKTLYIIVLLLVIGLIGCNESPNSVDAELTDYDTMIRQPGFQWIPMRMDEYVPSPKMLDSIVKYYDAGVFSFLIFAKPSCTCEGPHNDIGYMFRILEDVGISFPDIEIYAMNSIRNNHPYEENITINALPAFFVLKNDEVFYSVRDTLINRRENSIQHTLEQILFEALKNGE